MDKNVKVIVFEILLLNLCIKLWRRELWKKPIGFL